VSFDLNRCSKGTWYNEVAPDTRPNASYKEIGSWSTGLHAGSNRRGGRKLRPVRLILDAAYTQWLMLQHRRPLVDDVVPVPADDAEPPPPSRLEEEQDLHEDVRREVPALVHYGGCSFVAVSRRRPSRRRRHCLCRACPALADLDRPLPFQVHEGCAWPGYMPGIIANLSAKEANTSGWIDSIERVPDISLILLGKKNR
jgi:hypothetical protein